MASEGSVVSVTKKGHATVPKKLRQKYGIRKKALVVGTDEGILLRPIPDPSDERGSLKIVKGQIYKRAGYSLKITNALK